MSIATFGSESSLSATLIAGDTSGPGSIQRAVQAAGTILKDTYRIDDGSWDDRPLGELVIVDGRGCDGDRVASLLHTIGPRVASRQLIVIAALENLDAIDASCPASGEVLVMPDAMELQLALAAALIRARGGSAAVNDIAGEEGMRLQRLADEIARIARTLIDLPEGLAGTGGVGDALVGYRAEPGEADDVLDTSAVTASEVRAIIRLRRTRDRYFAPDLFADPAWDMLLDLAAARLERTRVAVSSLCIAAAVPPTTALRWIKAMTERGLFRRVADPHDARRIFIQLSDDAETAMDRYLRAARTAGASTI